MVTRDYSFDLLGGCRMITSIVKVNDSPCIRFQFLDFPVCHYAMTVFSSHINLAFVNTEFRIFINRATRIYMQDGFDSVLKGLFAEDDSIDNRLEGF